MENKERLTYIVLVKKDIEKDNKKFPVFYAYQQVLNDKGEFTDVLVPSTDSEGKAVMKSRRIKVVLTEDVKHILLADNMFPYIVTLQDEVDYFITIDKDIDGKPRLDKNGKKHAVLVMQSFKEYAPKPRKSMSFDDIDDIA